MRQSIATRTGVDAIAQHLPDQAVMNAELRKALSAMTELRVEVEKSHSATSELTAEMHEQASVLKRLDTVLWAGEKTSMRKLLDKTAT
jgi:ribosome-binding ATPase YchF (GTP1/OBG family)